MMRSAVAILLLSIHFMANSYGYQLFKLPKLVMHYEQHHKNNPSIGFVDFIAMHYWGDDGNPSDDNEDNQLPFKDIHYDTSFTSIAIMIHETNIAPEVNFLSPDTKIITYHSLTVAGYTKHPLRPPIA